MMIFTSKKTKKLIDDNLRLQQELELLKTKTKKKDENLAQFLIDFQEELLSTIDQHEVVNAQHDVLGELVGKIKTRFNNLEDSIEVSSVVAEKISHNGERLDEAAINMVSEALVGKELVLQVQKMIEELREEITNNTNLMTEIGERSRQIDDVVELINGIADETNLLALNASIEAARAGEHGRGFTIVAEKVRDLSEETSRSTQGISELTTNFQNTINETLLGTEESLKQVNWGIELSSEATNKFSDIEKVITSVQEQVSELQSYIIEQTESNLRAKEVMDLTHNDFSVANDLILSHIEEADTVDEKLEKGVNLIKELSGNIN